MKLIKQSHEILTDFSKYDGKSADELKQIIFSEIEVAGRTCYKSEENIKEGSAENFTNRMIKSEHGAMLEAGSVYLLMPNGCELDKYISNSYSKCNRIIYSHDFAVTTNYRILIENNWLDDLQYICSPTPFHELRVSVRFICDRAVQNQLVRHRSMSFAVQSQRYCNYSKDKFGNEVSFILPSWMDDKQLGVHDSKCMSDASKNIDTFCESDRAEITFLKSMSDSEQAYFELLKMGLKPEQARSVLPNATATEMVVTGFVSDWIKLFNLRTDKSAHPDMIALIEPLKSEFKERGWWKDEM